MASLAARYASGEHEAVWREMDFGLLSISEQFEIGYRNRPSSEEIEDVMRQTFERVARNTDRVIARLRDVGYEFECETRKGWPPVSPRRDARENAGTARQATLDRFSELEVTEFGPFPLAFVLFGTIVGNVDLRQSWSESDLDESSEDVVLTFLGDWDPLEIAIDYMADEIGQPDNQMHPMPQGGLGLSAEIAGSFEHKTDVSGAWNPNIYLPNYRIDPMVHAEGIEVSFTTYLRRMFARGGFYGAPRPIFRAPKSAWPPMLEVEPGIFLPDHPIFGQLAEGLEPF